jgi:mannan endo-1,4-beta-mannosidase
MDDAAHRRSTRARRFVIAALALLSAGCASSKSPGQTGAAGGETGGAGGDTAAGTAGYGGSAQRGGVYPVLTVAGRRLYDTCGNPLVIRGIEVSLGLGFEVNGSLSGSIEEVAKTGANAVRVLPDVTQLSVAQIAPIIAAAVDAGMVVFVSPGDSTWFGRSDAQALINQYEPYIVVDALQESNFDDPTKWLSDAKTAVTTMRGYGYRVPLDVISNQYGRDLPTALGMGAVVEATDTLHNTLLGWQAYWGSSNYYQSTYNLTLGEAVQKVGQASFPIQMGLDYETDPSETADYATLMNDAQAAAVGWLWWDWRLIGGDKSNDLSSDGTAANLTALGRDVITTQTNGIAKTAVKACRPAGF